MPRQLPPMPAKARTRAAHTLASLPSPPAEETEQAVGLSGCCRGCGQGVTGHKGRSRRRRACCEAPVAAGGICKTPTRHLLRSACRSRRGAGHLRRRQLGCTARRGAIAHLHRQLRAVPHAARGVGQRRPAPPPSLLLLPSLPRQNLAICAYARPDE